MKCRRSKYMPMLTVPELKFKPGLVILTLVLFLTNSTGPESFRGPPNLTELAGEVESTYYILGAMLSVASKR